MSATAISLGLLLSSLSPQLPPGDVLGAVHEAEVTRAGLRWRSSILLADPPRHAPPRLRLPLSPPLPPDVDVRLEAGEVERDVEGRITALVIDVQRAPLVHGEFGAARRVDVRTEQPRVTGSRLRLAAPLVGSEAVQRVTLVGAAPIAFHPDEGLGVDRRIGRAVGRDVEREARRRLDRSFGRLSPGHDTTYLRNSGVVAAAGLVGVLDEAPARRPGVGLAAAGAFGLLVLLAFAAYRRASRQAEMDRVDAILAEDYR